MKYDFTIKTFILRTDRCQASSGRFKALFLRFNLIRLCKKRHGLGRLAAMHAYVA